MLGMNLHHLHATKWLSADRKRTREQPPAEFDLGRVWVGGGKEERTGGSRGPSTTCNLYLWVCGQIRNSFHFLRCSVNVKRMFFETSSTPRVSRTEASHARPCTLTIERMTTKNTVQQHEQNHFQMYASHTTSPSRSKPKGSSSVTCHPPLSLTLFQRKARRPVNEPSEKRLRSTRDPLVLTPRAAASAK